MTRLSIKFQRCRIPAVSFNFIFLFFLLFQISPLNGENTDSLKKVLGTSSGYEKVTILNALAESFAEEQPGQAISYATEALQAARAGKLPKEEARALTSLGDASIELNNYTNAITHFQAAARITIELSGQQSDEYINRIADIGYCYLMMSQYERALDYFQQAAGLAEKAGNTEEMGNNYSNIATIYVEWGDYGKAVSYFEKVMKLDRKSGQEEKISTDLNNIGKMYELWGRFQQAVEYYQKALGIEMKTGRKAKIAVRLNNLGTAYKAWSKYPEALDYFQQALSIEQSMGDMEKVGKRLYHIGTTYHAMRQYDKCKTYLDQALTIFTKMDLHDELARLYNSYGLYYNAIYNYREAIPWFEKSQLLAKENNLRPLQISNAEALANAYEKTGQYQLAFSSQKMYLSLKDSVFTKESDKKLAEFRARFENEKMKMDFEMLQREAVVKSRTNLLIGTILASSILILLSVVFILRLRARNARQGKKISEQLAEQYLKDLEIKNSELAYNAMCIVRNNETVARMVEKVETALKTGRSTEEMETVLQNIKGMEVDHTWKEFEVRFTQVHKDFYDKLNTEFPDLTPNEIKLSAFLRLNMTTKDVASITHQSVNSINTARTRLRKKMNLANSEENLVNYLMKF